MRGQKLETIVEVVARAILESDKQNGHADESASIVSYLPAARAAIDAYHDYIRRHS